MRKELRSARVNVKFKLPCHKLRIPSSEFPKHNDTYNTFYMKMHLICMKMNMLKLIEYEKLSTKLALKISSEMIY